MTALSTPPDVRSIAVLGAGLAGLTAARALTEAGYDVRLFDKGRGPGGRMSSRREPFAFDHGAQYFTVRDASFQRAVDRWVGEGVVQPWDLRLGVAKNGVMGAKEPGPTRYVGVPRMSALTRHLSSGLDLQTRTRINRLTRVGDRWQLGAESGQEAGTFDTVLVTFPPEQAAALLGEPVPDLAATVQSVAMRPCWAVLAAFPDRLPVPFDGLFVDDAPVSWAARNASKPGRSEDETWVVHGSPSWSAEHIEDEADTVQKHLLRAFFDVTGCAPVEPEYATAHRWRYAMAAKPLDAGCFFDEAQRVGVGGDWCHGSRVEGAFLSGTALAECVLQAR